MPPQARIPPNDIKVERALLTACMLDAETADLAAEIVRPEDFYSHVHHQIWDAICDCLDAPEHKVDTTLVSSALKKRGVMGREVTEEYLLDLTNTLPNFANAEAYAQVVRDLAAARMMVVAGHTIASNGYGKLEDVEAYLDDSAELAVKAAEERAAGPKLVTVGEATVEAFEDLREAAERGGRVEGIGSGIVMVDRNTGGFRGGDLVILAGRPGMGKTAFTLMVMREAAQRGVAVFFSLEQPRKQLAERMMASEARVSGVHIRNATINSDDWPKLLGAVSTLQQLPLVLDDRPALSLLDMRRTLRRVRRDYGEISMVGVDYLQLMGSRSRAENRQLQVAEFSQGLKAMAKDLSCPVFALSQLNRGCEGRQNKRPMLSDLRESGAIEQDADQILFLYRDEVYQRTPDNHGKAEVIIGKNRHGPTGVCEVAWLADFMRFENLHRS